MSDKGTHSHSNRHRMHEVSDTPRTDAELRKPIHDTGIHNNLTEFCQELEREIRQLEVAIYDLKTENNLLHEALDQVIEDRDSYHEENAELCKYKERMEWLLATFDVVELVKDGKRLDWLQSSDLMLQEWKEGDVLCQKGFWSIRKFIDEAMEEAQ